MMQCIVAEQLINSNLGNVFNAIRQGNRRSLGTWAIIPNGEESFCMACICVTCKHMVVIGTEHLVERIRSSRERSGSLFGPPHKALVRAERLPKHDRILVRIYLERTLRGSTCRQIHLCGIGGIFRQGQIILHIDWIKLHEIDIPRGSTNNINRITIMEIFINSTPICRHCRCYIIEGITIFWSCLDVQLYTIGLVVTIIDSRNRRD